jgi:type I restriction-modification system DNA methylase subunit
VQTHLELGDQFNNRGLFADHFLNDPQGHLLKTLPEWQKPEGLVDAFRIIQKLFRDKAARFNEQTNEAQTERDFVRPVLDAVWGADCYEVQVSIPNLDARRQPDYALFRMATDRAAADLRKGAIEYWRDTGCLADAKKWSASLDKQRGADENPSGQIANYLYRSRVRWGILTNGRYWRLYERERSSAGGVFYEINLEDLLRRNDPEAFKYFYLFFRREAFLPDHSGRSFIDRVFQGSIEYATAVGDRLKESVYDALCHLMNGFLNYQANGLTGTDPATVKVVHENCLIVLYRMLFILYAEDRNLLSCDNEHYRHYCLRDLHREINRALRAQRSFMPQTTGHWNHLLNLFGLIDKGFPEGDVPAYNGGLFSFVRHPHIAHEPQIGQKRWEIGDRSLAVAIDLLAYDRKSWNEPGSKDIDYNSLDVRDLGSIYEGLLELQPHVASEHLVETIAEGKLVFKPVREVRNSRVIRGQLPRKVNPGDVYLVTNRGERKATGSYYTPQYIVDYIVEQTIGPLAELAAGDVAAMRAKIDKEIAELKKTREEWEKLKNAEQIDSFTKQIDRKKGRLCDPYLSLKIIDPAMGSGHFLVGVSDFLSLAIATDPNVIAPENIGDEEPQAYYKRQIVEHCLYGVDLNPLAVELAKLSLWLHTASKNKALSFLDHHLRCGNSLIGARVEDDLTKEPPRLNARGKCITADAQQLVLGFTEALTAKHLSYFLDTFRQIVDTPTGNADTERMKDTWYRSMDAVRDQFRAVANCWVAPYFGVPVSPDEYHRAVHALRDPAAFNLLKTEAWFANAQLVAKDKRFFHWDLEFPELFFDPNSLKSREQRGFDAALGNPPWISNDNISSELKQFLPSLFTVAESRYDLAHIFVERSTSLTKGTGGKVSLVIPEHSWFGEYFIPLRSFLFENCLLQEVVDLKEAFFEGVSNPASLFIASHKISETDQDRIRVGSYSAGEQKVQSFDFEKVIADNDIIIDNRGEVKHAHRIFFDKNYSILLRRFQGLQIEFLDRIALVSDGVQTANVIDVIMTDGNLSIDEQAKYHRALKSGQSIPSRYGAIVWEGWWMLRPEQTRHLKRPGFSYDSPKRIECFRRIPKIVLRQTEPTLFATLDDVGYFFPNSIFQISLRDGLDYKLHYLLALLNSSLLRCFYAMSSQVDETTKPQIYLNVLKSQPIRTISFAIPIGERLALLEQSKKAYKLYLATGDNTEVLRFAEEKLSSEPDRAEVVHDLLAYLAEQMIEAKKQQQVEARGFLDWLERQIGVKIDVLSSKTKVRNYYEHNLDELLSVLNTNRRKLPKGVNPSGRAFQDATGQEFSASMTKLAPLETRLFMTDTLINEVVYRLYALSDEEMNIVRSVA